MHYTTPNQTVSNLTNRQKEHLQLQREVVSLEKKIAEFKAKDEGDKRVAAARRLVIEKTFFSATQAAQKVGMPVTSFKRFVDKFNIGATATLDGLPCYSPEWIEAFKSNKDAIELGADSFSILKRKEGKVIMDRAIKAVNRFASGTVKVPSQEIYTKDAISKHRTLKDSNGKVMMATTNADGSNTYRDASGKAITTTTPMRSYKSDRIEAFMEANLRRHEESRKRFEAEQEERRKIQIAKLKGLTPVASFSVGK